MEQKTAAQGLKGSGEGRGTKSPEPHLHTRLQPARFWKLSAPGQGKTEREVRRKGSGSVQPGEKTEGDLINVYKYMKRSWRQMDEARFSGWCTTIGQGVIA